MHKIFKLLIISLVISGCKFQTPKSSEIIRLNTKALLLESKFNNQFDISELYKTPLKLIQLRQTSEFKIGQTDKIVYQNNKIFILDKSVARKLFVYTDKGNPVKLFNGTVGAEKYEITDFSVDNNVLYILDEKKKTILVFNLISGKFLDSFFIAPNNVCNIEALKGEIICYRNLVDNFKDIYGNATVFVMDNKGLIKDYWLPINKENQYLTFYSSDFPTLQKDHESIYISRFMDGSLYKYSTVSKKLINTYNLNFGSEEISQQLKAIEDDAAFVEKLESGKYSYQMSGYTETSSLVKFYVSRNRNIKTFFALKTGDNYEVSNIVYKKSFLPILFSAQITDQYFISCISSQILNDLRKDLTAGFMDDVTTELLKKLDPKNANPVIVVIKK